MDESMIPIGSYLHEAIERSRRAEERAAKARRGLSEATYEAEQADAGMRDAQERLRGLFAWVAQPHEDEVPAP